MLPAERAARSSRSAAWSRQGCSPPTTRTPAGYRTYTQVHALAAVAYVALTAEVGPIQAKTILRTAHRSRLPDLLGALDAAHARLHDERQAVLLAQDVLTAISAEPINDPRADDAMTISQLAGALGVRASALRHWENEGLLTPTRSTTGTDCLSSQPAAGRCPVRCS